MTYQQQFYLLWAYILGNSNDSKSEISINFNEEERDIDKILFPKETPTFEKMLSKR